MELKLYTETTINSAHFIKGYDGLCKNIHGHDWKICIWIKGDYSLCDKTGILFDFNNVKKIKEKYDHKLLNEINPFDVMNPTAENISFTIYCFLHHESKPGLQFKVRVYETSIGKETYCECGDFE